MSSWGRLPPLGRGRLPPFPGWWKALGPGVIWLALAQGSGELIWWPYLIAKYGLAFLVLLVPACLLQFPINYAIGSYTLLTGETIFQGFLRLHRFVGIVMWILMTCSFLWFGAFASAGGTALAALTDFPPAWDERGRTLFWAYASMAVFVVALIGSRVVYTVVERVMEAVALITIVGLVVACSHPTVVAQAPEFLRGLVVPHWPPARPWEPADATKLLTAITFAGLGGFWTLFYSYWLREKGAGMARDMGHVEGLAGPSTRLRMVRRMVSEVEPPSHVGVGVGMVPEPATPIGAIRPWRRFLVADSAVGIVGNILTTLMTCLLAYAVLFPQGLLPEKYQLAVVQARFFEVSWGAFGRWLFLLVAAAFLSDTWMATADAVARIHTDCVLSVFPAARRRSVRWWYLTFLILLTVVTSVTMWVAEPGPLILLSALVGFLGTVSFAFLLYWLNHRYLPTVMPRRLCPQRPAAVGLGIAGAAYATLAVAYLWVRFGS